MPVPAAPEGRFYVPCPSGATTPLTQGTAGSRGDDIDHIWIEAGAGTVALIDGATTVFTWDATAAERFVPLAWKAKGAAGWSITATGVSAVATGVFS
jgi:hypothetical protein